MSANRPVFDRCDRLPPAIIVDGDVNAVSIARSLSRMGVRVFAVNRPDAHVRYTRFARAIKTAFAVDKISEWADFLTGPRSDFLRGGVLLAAGDAGIELITQYRDSLQERFLLDISFPRAQSCMLNKLCTYQAARDAGVPVPRFWSIRSAEDVAALAASLVFPLIVKPRIGHLFQSRFGRKFFVVSDAEQLHAVMGRAEAAETEVMLVEKIPSGDDRSVSYYTYVAEDGSPLFHFTRKLLRRYPIQEGPATYQTSCELDPAVVGLSRRLIEQVGLLGLANVEFLKDERDGQFKLIECNARFTAANEMLVKAGIDLPRFVYSRIVGLPRKEITTYRSGVSIWHPIEDFLAFRQLRREGDCTLREWLASVCRPHALPLFCWHDPLPSLIRLLKRARRMIRVSPPRSGLVSTAVSPEPVEYRQRESSSENSPLQPRTHYIMADDLKAMAVSLFMAAGVSRVEATIVADSLVAANLSGHDSHGVMRIGSYIEKIRNREVVLDAPLHVENESPAFLMVDGNWGFGQVQCRRLCEMLISKGWANGFAVGTLKHATHVGRLGEYAAMAAEAGLVSLIFVNSHGTSRWVAPPGGKEARLGTNPIAYGIPNGNRPLIFDFSTGATSEGKVRLRHAAGERCPPHWLRDAEGRPTDDAGVLYRKPSGTIAPLGGEESYKGFGLALLAEVMAGALSGGVCSRERPVNQKGNCVFMQVMNPDMFCGVTEFTCEVSRLIEYVRACPRTDERGEIVLPGDRSRGIRAIRAARGIPLDEEQWSGLSELAKRAGVPVRAAAAAEERRLGAVTLVDSL